ncbi:hypothetical protein, partial [Bacillus sp. WP8]|uniref:hypothetical protein n=1 Tax=Bacillus sp. WP8 TaxID=756828 RepID=UPI001C92E392
SYFNFLSFPSRTILTFNHNTCQTTNSQELPNSTNLTLTSFNFTTTTFTLLSTTSFDLKTFFLC